MERIRLLLLDDDVLFQESLGRLLAADASFDVVAQCGNAAGALEAVQRVPVDVVLLDFELGHGQGNRFISAARRAGYKGKILMVTARTDASESSLALQLGVSGIFLKQNPPSSLIRVIRQIAAGEMWVDQSVIQLMAGGVSRGAKRDLRQLLTEREQQVLKCIIDGFTNRRIAEQIGVSEGAIKATLQRLFRKTQVRTRSQLVRVALEAAARPSRKTAPLPAAVHRS